jgi:hypothetical protein
MAAWSAGHRDQVGLPSETVSRPAKMLIAIPSSDVISAMRISYSKTPRPKRRQIINKV